MALVMLATSGRGETRLLHDTGRRRAEEREAGLLVVSIMSGSDYERQPAGLRRAIRDEMKWLLHAMVVPTEGSSRSSIGRIVVEVREGDVVDRLIEVAESSRPDLVVLGEQELDSGHALPTEEYERLLQYFESRSIRVEQVPTG